MGKKLVINCETGEQEAIDLTAKELADIPIRQTRAAEMKAKMERNRKINAEMRKMAEESLIAKGEIEREGGE